MMKAQDYAEKNFDLDDPNNLVRIFREAIRNGDRDMESFIAGEIIDRLQRAEEEKQEYEAMWMELRGILFEVSSQLLGEKGLPDPDVWRRDLLKAIGQLQRDRRHRKRLANALRAVHYHIEDEAEHRSGKIIIDVADWDWDVPDLDTLLDDLESDRP